jgi:hypothetical protein
MMRVLYETSLSTARVSAPHITRNTKMKKIMAAVLSLLFVCSVGLAAQKSISSSTKQDSNSSTKKRGPVFRATKDQINQAQTILKARGFFDGEQSGKLDTASRDGLKKYQAAEGIKVTGTLNRVTLEKMGIELTEKQRTM